MRKLTTATALLISAMIVVSGCGQDTKNVQGSGGGQPTVSASPSPTAKTAPPADEKQTQIKAYYGDSSGTSLVQKNVQIRYTTEDAKYLSALNALKTSQDPQAVSLVQYFTFKLPVLKDGTLTVDLIFKDEARFGANGEDLLLQAIQKTLFQFDEVKAIEILVDGKKVDSLMGHKDLPHPIKRS